MKLLRLSLPLAAAALLTTCSGLTTGTCGKEGQACCTGKVCESLLSCGAGDTCTPCGRSLGECCAGDVCAGELVCVSGGCFDPSCNSPCIPNSKRCSAGGGLEVCSQVGVCAAWTTLLSVCPNGFDCVPSASSAECVERCPNSCSLTSLVCTATGLTKCQTDTITSCPALFPFTDDSTAPVCLAGACEGNWCWESPQPQGTTLVSIDGWAIDQFWVLDALGNILRRDGNGWTYEHRTQPNKTARALSQCGTLQGYLIAVGDNGTVLRRIFGGTWVEESVGDPTAQLIAVSCANNFRAFAVGANGKVFVRDQLSSGIWRALASGTTVQLRGASYHYFTGDGWAVGDNGTILRCRDLNTPSTATCTVETSTVSTELDAVKTNGANGDVLVVGKGGVILLRTGGGWTPVGTNLTQNDLVSVGVAPATASNFVLVGKTGSIFRGSTISWVEVTPPGTGPLTSVFTLDDGTVVAVGANGAMWFNRSGGSQNAWNALGGAGPIRADLEALGGLGPEDLWAAGQGGQLYHRVQSAWAREATGVVQGRLYGVAVADGGEVFAVGDTVGDVVLAGRPGKWATEPQGTAAILYGVLVDDVRAVAVGEGGAWMERARGTGNAWTAATPSATSEALYGIAGRVSGGRTTFPTAVGTNCTVVTRNPDAGFTSSVLPGCSGETLYAVWQGQDGELLVGGDNGYVARRLNGTWTREYLGSTIEPVVALTQSGNRSWAACQNGDLYIRVNGTWQQELPRFLASGLRAAWSNASGDVWVAGPGGTLLRGR